MAPRKISRLIFLIFTKKHGLHVQADATKYLETLLEDDPNVQETLEKLIKLYRKRFAEESSPIITKTAMEQVVTAMQMSAAAASTRTPFERSVTDSLDEGMQDMTLEEKVDVTEQFTVVNAFNMPRLHYDAHRKTFIQPTNTSDIFGNGNDKSAVFLERYHLIKQRLLRNNENFDPASMHIHGSGAFQKITPIKGLIGHDNERFLLFGMLTCMDDGKIYLEDDDGHIQLDLSNCIYGPGLYTETTFVIAEGLFGDDHIFHVEEINPPPAESRQLTESLFPHINFLGLPKQLLPEHVLKHEEVTNEEIQFVILSDVHLDEPKVINALRLLFYGYSNTRIPLAFILIGNFTSRPFKLGGAEAAKYKQYFNTLADLILEFPAIATHSYFVFVPGSRDPWGGNCLPQAAIPDLFTTRIRQRIRRAIFASNPCRIRYCTQDIVIYRDDILSRLWRNALLPPKTEEDPRGHLVRTIVDQGHLCPLPLYKRPIYLNYDQALRIYPLPHALVLADQCHNFGYDYEGTHCMSPGSFPNSDFTWSVYYPAKKMSEKCNFTDV